MKAMLLAAGRGERMGQLTGDRPKALLSLGPETLIERHLRRLAGAGIEEIVVNLSYCGDQIRDAIGETSKWGQTIHYSDEPEPPLETAGGIIRALPILGPDPFIVVSADVVSGFDLTTLERDPDKGCLIMVPNPPHHRGGDFGISSLGILSAEPPLLTYSGIAVLSPSLFANLDPGVRPLRPVLDVAIERSALRGVVFEGLWHDVGTPERLAEASFAVERSG